MIAFLVLEVGMIGVFLALDLFLFYIFWEIVLVPMYLIIGIWGGANRIYSTIKFVLYTLVGSLLMLVAILATAFAYQAATGRWAGAFDFLTLRDFAAGTGFAPALQIGAFIAFFLAFAIKVPMFPFHTWLPDAHTDAPTAGSVILAGIMLKLGAYGFIRFAIPLFPDAAHTFAPTIIMLSLIAIIYGAIVALVQPDLKRLVAYSSVSHMGFVTLGLFVFTEQGVQGAILQMINHGLITGGLFLLVGVIYERTHDRTIAKMGGLAGRVPVWAATFGFFVFASAGLPGLSGFVGEFLSLVGTFLFSPAAAAIATFCMILARGVPAVDVPAGGLRRGVAVPREPRRSRLRHDAGRDPDPRPAGDTHRAVRRPARIAPQPRPGQRHRHARGRAGGLADPGAVRARDRGRDRGGRAGGRARQCGALELAGRHRRRGRRRGSPLTSADIYSIAPLIAAVLTAAAVLLVDLVRPGRSDAAIGTALVGLAATAVVTIVVGGPGRPRSAARTRSTR